MQPDAANGFVEGTYMDRSIADFIRGCRMYLEAEQRKLDADTALIGLLCDAIRCARELARKDGLEG